MTIPLGYGTDIKTKVVLKNETSHSVAEPGMAGKVGLVGAFPTADQSVVAVTNYAEFLNKFKLQDTAEEAEFEGMRAIQHIFMNKFPTISGATSVTCVNTNTSEINENTITAEKYYELSSELRLLQNELRKDESRKNEIEAIAEAQRTSAQKEELTLLTTEIKELKDVIKELNELIDVYNDSDIPRIAEGKMLTFEKLRNGLHKLADDDSDILFIANDLFDCVKKQMTISAGMHHQLMSAKSETYLNWSDEKKKNYTLHNIVIDKTEHDAHESHTFPILAMNPDGTIGLKCPYKDPTLDDASSSNWNIDTKTEEIFPAVFLKEGLPKSKTWEFYSNPMTLSNIVEFSTGLDQEWTCDAVDVKGNPIYGKASGKLIRNIGDVYDYVLDFIDNKFSSHHPCTYIGYIRTDEPHDAETFTNGIGSTSINVKGEGNVRFEKDNDGVEEIIIDGVEKWGAKQIAQVFTRETNELSTAGLFFQGGTIGGEKVGPMELAAHMCGWIAGKRVNEDLTYREIPGLTSISEELYFGEGDAGTELNNYGIQVIVPKNRLDKTFYVNNSIMPSGWHTNHIRSVNYLLKKYAFEAGLGINNFTANVEAFRASLEQVSQEVMSDVDVIRNIEIGDVVVMNNYHIYVPIDIVLAGVVTKISVGVSMAIDETGEVTTTQSTSGYNFYY